MHPTSAVCYLRYYLMPLIIDDIDMYMANIAIDTRILLEWTNFSDQYHRDVGPAYIGYFTFSGRVEQEWYHNGKIYRFGDNPTRIIHYGDGYVAETWLDVSRRLHRIGGSPQRPAMILYDWDGEIHSEKWMRYGSNYREDGGPDEVVYNNNGEINEAIWVRNYGSLLDGPLRIIYNLFRNVIEISYRRNGKENTDIVDSLNIEDVLLNMYAQTYINNYHSVLELA